MCIRDRRTMLAYSNAMPSVAMVRRSAFDAVGGFHLGMELIEDQDFFIRVALLGETGFVDEVLVITHTQPAGLSHRTWRWDIEVWPAVRRHIEAQKDRLSFGERRHIYGFRYARLGRNVYAEAPLHLSLIHI